MDSREMGEGKVIREKNTLAIFVVEAGKNSGVLVLRNRNRMESVVAS